jgi:hypothetical protein
MRMQRSKYEDLYTKNISQGAVKTVIIGSCLVMIRVSKGLLNHGYARLLNVRNQLTGSLLDTNLKYL